MHLRTTLVFFDVFAVKAVNEVVQDVNKSKIQQNSGSSIQLL